MAESEMKGLYFEGKYNKAQAEIEALKHEIHNLKKEMNYYKRGFTSAERLIAILERKVQWWKCFSFGILAFVIIREVVKWWIQ